MRVAALYDIHGNLPALEAVLADVESEQVDAIVVAGDSVSGPLPAEVLERLLEIGALVVRGNADRHVLELGGGLGDPEAALGGGAPRLSGLTAWPSPRAGR